MTQACRINGEPHTQFPYMCALADLLRARKTLAGIRFKLSGGDERVLHVREYSFLNNHKVPQEIKVGGLKGRRAAVCWEEGKKSMSLALTSGPRILVVVPHGPLQHWAGCCRRSREADRYDNWCLLRYGQSPRRPGHPSPLLLL
jgi:hypothetical protein